MRSLKVLIPEEVPERLPGGQIYRNFLPNATRKLPGSLGSLVLSFSRNLITTSIWAKIMLKSAFLRCSRDLIALEGALLEPLSGSGQL